MTVEWWWFIPAFIAWMVGWFVFYRHRLSRLGDIATHYTASLAKQHQDADAYAWLLRHSHEFVALINGAGIEDSTLAYAEPVGYGQLMTGTASAVQNWLALRQDAVLWTIRAFEQARGVYEARAMSSLNPMHWVVMVVTLPMQAVKWVGGNPDGSLSRALTALWWLVGVVGLILGLFGWNLFDFFQASV